MRSLSVLLSVLLLASANQAVAAAPQYSVTDLGTLGGTSSYATGINNRNEVVGEAYTSSDKMHAFEYSDDSMEDLNSLLPSGSGWTLTEATGINDLGQIVGDGTIDGQSARYRSLVAALRSIILEDRDPKQHTESNTMNPNGQHNQLLRLRARLLGDMNQLADTALQDSNTIRMPSDMADVGTDAFEQELAVDLLGNEKEVLEQIEVALERIEDGSYGKLRRMWPETSPRPGLAGDSLCGVVREVCCEGGKWACGSKAKVASVNASLSPAWRNHFSPPSVYSRA